MGYEVRDEGEALLAQLNDLVNTGEPLKALLLEVKSHQNTASHTWKSENNGNEELESFGVTREERKIMNGLK